LHQEVKVKKKKKKIKYLSFSFSKGRYLISSDKLKLRGCKLRHEHQIKAALCQNVASSKRPWLSSTQQNPADAWHGSLPDDISPCITGAVLTVGAKQLLMEVCKHK